jgi:hypothetical protein
METSQRLYNLPRLDYLMWPCGDFVIRFRVSQTTTTHSCVSIMILTMTTIATQADDTEAVAVLVVVQFQVTVVKLNMYTCCIAMQLPDLGRVARCRRRLGRSMNRLLPLPLSRKLNQWSGGQQVDEIGLDLQTILSEIMSPPIPKKKKTIATEWLHFFID